MFIQICEHMEGKSDDTYKKLKDRLEKSSELDELSPANFIDACKEAFKNGYSQIIEEFPFGSCAKKLLN